MAQIIDFPLESKVVQPTQRKEPEPKRSFFDYDKANQYDSFEQVELGKDEEEIIRKFAGYSLDEMIQMVGVKETERIFSQAATDLRKGEPAYVVASPTVDKKSFVEGMKEIWDNSDEARELQLAKRRELYRTQHAFRRFEDACSEKYRQKFGDDTRIRISVNDGERSVYLTDELQKQIDFYKKGKLGKTFSFIGIKMQDGISRLADRIKND